MRSNTLLKDLCNALKHLSEINLDVLEELTSRSRGLGGVADALRFIARAVNSLIACNEKYEIQLKLAREANSVIYGDFMSMCGEVVKKRWRECFREGVGRDYQRLIISKPTVMGGKKEVSRPAAKEVSAGSVEEIIEELKSIGIEVKTPQEVRREVEVQGLTLDYYGDEVKDHVMKCLNAWRVLDELSKKNILVHYSMLLYGPPGCGKSSLPKIIASELDAYLVAVSFARIASKWYGETSKNLLKTFNGVKELAKRGGKTVVLFMDEFEAIARKRTDSLHQADMRLVDTLLEQITDMMTYNVSRGGNEKPVIMIAATNYKELLDEAVIRPGRFDLWVSLPPPNMDKFIDTLSKKLYNQVREIKDKLSIELEASSVREAVEEVIKEYKPYVMGSLTGAHIDGLIKELNTYILGKPRGSRISKEEIKDRIVSYLRRMSVIPKAP